jgi:hypothetical protein
VQISQPINFLRPPDGADHIDLLTLTAGEDVYLDSETVDPNQGRTSIIRMYVRNLRVDQRSGEVLADGPGWVTSVSVGDDESFSLQHMVASSQPAELASGPKTSPLVYLNVKFRDRLIGNLYDREVRLVERVQAVYGPVSSWSEQVDPDATDGLGPQDVRLYANELKVAQFGEMVGNQRPMELTAVGDAVVEGKAFDARCHQIKYVQAKDLLILEGDARQAAELRQWNETGGPVARSVARYFYLWPRRREFRMDNGQFGEFLGPAGAMSDFK